MIPTLAILALIPARDAFGVLAWGACMVLAGLYVTRETRPRPLGAAALSGRFVVALLAADARRSWPNPTTPPLPAPHHPPAGHAPAFIPDIETTTGVTMPEIPNDYDTNPVPDYGDEILDPESDHREGDVVNAPEVAPSAPVIPVPVIINVSDLEQPDGDRAIFVSLPRDGRITSPQAAIMERHLARARAMVDDARRTMGF